MLVKRANQVLEREKDRIEKLSDTIPAPIADKLRKSLQETTQDVEGIKADIKKKHKEVKRSLKQYMKAERSLKQANQKLDSLEMDNYNLRENFNE
jgi:chromosome segregation ATPase